MATVKRAARHLVDRVLTPHLDAQTAAIAELLAQQSQQQSSTDGAVDLVLTDFNHLLHELRTIALRDLPATGRTLLSAGCAGAWYFDWVDAAVGPLVAHVGVELYSPRPDGLADNVQWIEASASSMPEVGDSSVDVVFSGQNFEHLWIDDMIGFLLESWRVLRPGGTLALDSPNRLITEQLGWVHPEHTIEITASEAVDLLQHAGFDVVSLRPLWRCRARDGQLLALVPEPGDVRSILDRAVAGFDIDAAFVWWIEARRADRPPDRAEVEATVRRLFQQLWNSRVNRAAACDPDRYQTQAFPIFAGPFRVSAVGDQTARVRVLRADGSELAVGTGVASGVLDSTEFGVTAEVVTTQGPLSEGVAVSLGPS